MRSAMLRASSSSTPRYRTVLSILVWPSKSWTARRLPFWSLFYWVSWLCELANLASFLLFGIPHCLERLGWVFWCLAIGLTNRLWLEPLLSSVLAFILFIENKRLVEKQQHSEPPLTKVEGFSGLKRLRRTVGFFPTEVRGFKPDFWKIVLLADPQQYCCWQIQF